MLNSREVCKGLDLGLDLGRNLPQVNAVGGDAIDAGLATNALADDSNDVGVPIPATAEAEFVGWSRLESLPLVMTNLVSAVGTGRVPM